MGSTFLCLAAIDIIIGFSAIAVGLVVGVYGFSSGDELNLVSYEPFTALMAARTIIRFLIAYLLVWSGLFLLKRSLLQRGISEVSHNQAGRNEGATYKYMSRSSSCGISRARCPKPVLPTGPIHTLTQGAEEVLTESSFRTVRKRHRRQKSRILDVSTVCNSEGSSIPTTPVSEQLEEVSPIAQSGEVPDTIAMIWRTVHHDNSHAVWSDCACCRNTTC